MHDAVVLLKRLLRRPDVRRLLRSIAGYDAGTHRHSLRVARLAVEMGMADGFEGNALADLAVAALFHDVGKTGLEHDVLTKAGPLDAEERTHVREHPRLGVDALKRLPAFPGALRIAPLHHELGEDDDYPRQGGERRRSARAGEDRRSPLSARTLRAGRILALADRFDALVSHRPYKGPVAVEEAQRRLAKEMPDVAPLLRHVRLPSRPPR